MGRFPPSNRLPPALPVLLTFAALMESIYVVSFLRPFPLLRYYRANADMGQLTDHSHAAYALFIVSVTVLFLLLAFAWNHVHAIVDARLLPWILGCGGIFVVTLAFVYPITAIDLYAYVDQSWIMVHYHQNPIFVPPDAFPADPLMRLSDGWSGVGAPYGPLGLVIDAGPAVFLGRNLLANLLILKLLFGAFVVLSAYVVYRILQRIAPRHALSGAILVAWNPLILFESVANGHNDIAMVLFALLALLSTVEGDLVLGVVLLAAACLIKFATLVLLPLFLVHGLARHQRIADRGRFLSLALVGSVAVTAVAYARFWQGPDTLARLVAQDQRFLVSFGSVASSLVWPPLSVGVATGVGRALFLCAYAYALSVAVGPSRELSRASFIALFALLGFGVTNVESWYAIWPAVLAAAVPALSERVAAVLFAWGISLAAAFFGYEWWWLGLSNPSNFTYENIKSYVLAFLPPLLALVVLRSRGDGGSRWAWRGRGPFTSDSAVDVEPR